MKKVFSIILYSLLIATIVSIGLCFAIIPERTKLAFDVVVEWANKPLPIAGFSILTIGLVVATIISRTQLGVKLLSQLRHELDIEKQAIANKQKELEKKEQELELKKQEINTILLAYDKQIEIIENKLVVVCETIPNAKVKALVPELKNEINECKSECDTKLSEIKEYDSSVKDSYEKRLSALCEKLEYLESVVSQYGKREETTND